MARHAKTQRMIDEAIEILRGFRPMTVRQVYYQLVSRQAIKNNGSQYEAVCKALVAARKEGLIPWSWIEDRTRRPRSVSMWSDLSSFGDAVLSAYRRDIWATQPDYFEVWLEKDALSGLFEETLKPFGVTLNVGRGYDGWSSIKAASARLTDDDSILYFGDLDPSGVDMERSLQKRLAELGCRPTFTRYALTVADIAKYNLPQDFAKKTDSRFKAFVKEFGDISVEIDALPTNVLLARLKSEVESRLDMDALEETRADEETERDKLTVAIERMTA